jgi:hypothetical protein
MYAHKFINLEGREMEIEFKLLQLATRVNKIAAEQPHRVGEGKIKM